jgi:hypothetical protein
MSLDMEECNSMNISYSSIIIAMRNKNNGGPLLVLCSIYVSFVDVAFTAAGASFIII